MIAPTCPLTLRLLVVVACVALVRPLPHHHDTTTTTTTTTTTVTGDDRSSSAAPLNSTALLTAALLPPPTTAAMMITTAASVAGVALLTDASDDDDDDDAAVAVEGAAGDVGDAADAARRLVRLAPPWRHLAAAKNSPNYAPNHWNHLPPPPPTAATPPPVRPPGGPRFGRVPAVIEVWPGQTAILSCVVHNLGDRMVSWIRVSDLQILTAGAFVFTSDSRMSVDFEAAAAAADAADGNQLEYDDGDNDDDEDDDDANGGRRFAATPLVTETSWPLTIRQVRASDVGMYECQINTEPKMKGNVSLLVHEPQLADLPFTGVSIDGDREPVVAAGSHIRLVCRSPPAPPMQSSTADVAVGPLVTWLLDGRTLSGGAGGDGFGEEGSGSGIIGRIGGGGSGADTGGRTGGGVNVLTELSPAAIVSTLTLAAASESDAGGYECRVRDLGADAVKVQVVRKGGGGGDDSSNGIIVQPWRLSDHQQQHHHQQENQTQNGGITMAGRWTMAAAAFQALVALHLAAI